MAAATRRERLRTETTADIKAAAWIELQASGLQDLSLRSVARRLGMAPSALYRYFENRDVLVTAMLIDAYSAFGAVLEKCYERAKATPRARAHGVYLEVAKEYRRWALDHPVEYKLIYGTTIPGYTGTEQTTQASMRATDVLLSIMSDLLAEDGLDTKAWKANLTPDLRRRFRGWTEKMPTPLPAESLLAALSCYATLHGAINVEMYSHLPPMLEGSEDLFVAIINRSLDGLRS